MAEDSRSMSFREFVLSDKSAKDLSISELFLLMEQPDIPMTVIGSLLAEILRRKGF